MSSNGTGDHLRPRHAEGAPLRPGTAMGIYVAHRDIATWEAARKFAIRHRVSFASVVVQALADYLAAHAVPNRRPKGESR